MLRQTQLLCIAYLTCLFSVSAFGMPDIPPEVSEETYMPRSALTTDPGTQDAALFALLR